MSGALANALTPPARNTMTLLDNIGFAQVVWQTRSSQMIA
jgi:hypothetical protein